MATANPKDKMRAAGWAFDGVPIEFLGEPERFFAKILYEHLPPARECGAGRTVPINVDRKIVDGV